MLSSFFANLKLSLSTSVAWKAPARLGMLRAFPAKSHHFSFFSIGLLLAFSPGLCLTLSGCIANAVDRSQLQTLVASPNSVDLGNVPVGNSASTSVSVVNGNSVPVTITQLGLTGPSFAIPGQNSLPISIAAGGTYSFNVTFAPAAAGPAIGKLAISSDASTSPTLINLTGTGAAESQTAPQLIGLSCSEASMGGTGTDSCTVTLSGPALAGGFRVGLSSNNAALTTQTGVLVEPNATSAQFIVNLSPVSAAQTAVLTASAGAVTETFPVQLSVPAPALSVTPASLAFGNLTVNTHVTQTVTISSTGTAPVTISGATLTGAGFTMTPATFPVSLNPGQKTTLILQFDPSAEGAATGQLTFTSNSSANSTATVALSGTGEPQLTGLSCSNASMGGTGTDSCTVTLSGPALAGGFRVGLSSNNGALTTQTGVLVQANATSAQFIVNVSPVSAAQTAVLTASAGTVTEAFPVQLGVPAPTLSVTPASLAFGNVTMNTPVTQTVTITSTGTAPVTISGATLTGAGFTMTPATFPVSLNPGQKTTLIVQFDPSAEGAATGQLAVASNSSVNSKAMVALSGTAEPQLTGLSCGSASMGGTGTDSCMVTLSGPALAGGFRVGLSSNNAALTTQTGVLVQANATSAQFIVNVSPVSAPQTAVLTASAGTVNETFPIQLSVPAPALSVTPASLVFGNLTVNTPVAQTVTVTSTGTAPVTISGATLTGAGFTMTPATFPVSLNPGQKTTLIVQFDPSAEGAATGQLTITNNSSADIAATVALSGTGEPQLTGLSCSNASMVGTGTDPCTVTLSGPALAGGFRVGLSSSNAALTTQTGVLVQANATSAQFIENVSPVSTLQTAVLTASAGTVTETFPIQLSVPTPTLSLTPAGLVFGNVPVNVTETQTVMLKSTGTAVVTVTGAIVSGAGFSMTPAAFPVSLSPGQTISLGVQFDPSAEGATIGRLTVTSNSSISGTTSVALSGAGAPAGSFAYTGSPIESTLVPPNPTAPISGDFFGMTILHSATPFPAFPVSVLRFWDVIAWPDVEPSEGQFDWTRMDSTIASTEENGVSDFIFTFGSVPTWASTDPSAPCTGGDGPGSCAPPDMTAFDDLATAMVQRYCGKIKYYETWNEPNNSSYWSGTNAQLLTISQDLYQIAKDPANCGCANGVCSPNGGANPNQVLMPPISGINSSNLSWLDSYLAGAGAQYPYADIAAFHGYGLGSNPEGIVTEVQSLNQTLANHGLSNLPLWNTEASWGSQTSVDRQQASWLMRYHAALALTGVSRFVWYAYDNCGWGTLWEAPWCTDPQMPTGQVTAPGQAYGVIESWLSGAELSDCQEYENGLWSCALQRPGGYQGWMLWSSSGTDISVPIPADTNLIEYRDWQNNVQPLPTELTVDEMPVLIENHVL